VPAWPPIILRHWGIPATGLSLDLRTRTFERPKSAHGPAPESTASNPTRLRPIPNFIFMSRWLPLPL
jgi:hypothetical protein